jgi:hypothetical protein
MIYRHSNPRCPAVLGATLAGSLAVAIATGHARGADSGDEEDHRQDADAISAELNQAETVQGSCRLSFVIRNRTSYPLVTLRWDLVFFDTGDFIVNRLATQVGALAAGKTSVKSYEIPGLDCGRLRRVLLNHVTTCEGARAEPAPFDCLQRTLPSSRIDIEFIK